MTHSKSGKIKILVFGLLLILFGIAVNYYVIRNFIIWGPEKGRLAVFLWMILSVSFTLMLLLDKFKILILYAISIPFLLRLNVFYEPVNIFIEFSRKTIGKVQESEFLSLRGPCTLNTKFPAVKTYRIIMIHPVHELM